MGTTTRATATDPPKNWSVGHPLVLDAVHLVSEFCELGILALPNRHAVVCYYNTR